MTATTLNLIPRRYRFAKLGYAYPLPHPFELSTSLCSPEATNKYNPGQDKNGMGHCGSAISHAMNAMDQDRPRRLGHNSAYNDETKRNRVGRAGASSSRGPAGLFVYSVPPR